MDGSRDWSSARGRGSLVALAAVALSASVPMAAEARNGMGNNVVGTMHRTHDLRALPSQRMEGATVLRQSTGRKRGGYTGIPGRLYK